MSRRNSELFFDKNKHKNEVEKKQIENPTDKPFYGSALHCERKQFPTLGYSISFPLMVRMKCSACTSQTLLCNGKGWINLVNFQQHSAFFLLVFAYAIKKVNGSRGPISVT